MVAKLHRPLRAVLAVGVALAVAPLAFAPAAHAADNGRWSVFPIKNVDNNLTPRQFFIVDSAPDRTIRDAATVTNNTAQPLTLDLYPADAYNTAVGGGFALKRPTDPQTDVGSWMKLSKSRVTVPAAKSTTDKNGNTTTKPGVVNVPFTINVPADASAGDHAGGLVTSDVATIASADPAQSGVRIRQANAVRVYVRVAGPINPQLLVTDVKLSDVKARTIPFVGDDGSATVSYTVVNSGNARITPDGVLKVTGLLGQTISKTDASISEILPGQSVRLQEQIKGMPALDRVQARIELTSTLYPAANTAGDAYAWSISWIFVAILVVVIAVAIAYVVRRRRQGRAPAGEAEGGRRRSAPVGT